MAFIQLHILRTLPFSNPNRDDAGRPKTGIMGGVERLRLSSQSIKRAIRESDAFFAAAFATTPCHRTRTVPRMVARSMIEAGIPPEHVEAAIIEIVGALMSIKPRGTGKTASMDLETWLAKVGSEEMVFMTQAEIDRLTAFCLEIAQSAAPQPKAAAKKKGKAGEEEEKLLSYGVKAETVVSRVFCDAGTGVDIALFGRMLAKTKATEDKNVDGAVQVNHAMTTHRAVAEDDYFTAMDDLDENGAGLIQSQGFGSGTYYSYVCIDTRTLVENLDGDTGEAARAIEAFIRAAIQSIPGGKKTAFAHATLPFFARLEVGDYANRSLADAFTAPVTDGDIQAASVKRIEDLLARQARAYGDPGLRSATLTTLADESASLDDLVRLGLSAVAGRADDAAA